MQQQRNLAHGVQGAVIAKHAYVDNIICMVCGSADSWHEECMLGFGVRCAEGTLQQAAGMLPTGLFSGVCVCACVGGWVVCPCMGK
jgi:hypothetical protein